MLCSVDDKVGAVAGAIGGEELQFLGHPLLPELRGTSEGGQHGDRYWHANGVRKIVECENGPGPATMPLAWTGERGAGDGNRTRTVSLED